MTGVAFRPRAKMGCMGVLTPLAVKVGAVAWMPRLLPQIVKCDNALQGLTRERVSLLDVAGLPNITLQVPGRKSGAVRRTRLLAVPVGRDWLIAGSYFGAAKVPQWVYNLRAARTCEVDHHGTVSRVSARELDGVARKTAWQQMRAVWPNFDLYEQRTDRLIPVFRLSPAD